MNEVCQVPAIIEDHIKRLATFEASNGLFNTPEIFFLRFTLPCKDGNTSRCDTRCIISIFLIIYSTTLTPQLRDLVLRKYSMGD